MVRIADCDACQVGDHKNHQRTIQGVSAGMLGGGVCPCKGECVEDATRRRARFLARFGMTPAVMAAIRKASAR